MIEGKYMKLNSGDYITTGLIKIPSSRRVPKAVVNAEWAEGRCSLTRTTNGSLLTIRPEYEWDGASSPVGGFNHPETMEATLHHDALYEAMRKLIIPRDMGKIPTSIRDSAVLNLDRARIWADRCMEEILRRDKARAPMRETMAIAVKLAGLGYAWPDAWPPATRLIPRR